MYGEGLRKARSGLSPWVAARKEGYAQLQWGKQRADYVAHSLPAPETKAHTTLTSHTDTFKEVVLSCTSEIKGNGNITLLFRWEGCFVFVLFVLVRVKKCSRFNFQIDNDYYTLPRKGNVAMKIVSSKHVSIRNQLIFASPRVQITWLHVYT